MAANNDLGSLSYSLNIDISQLPDTIRNVEKQLSAITTIADISTRVDSNHLIGAIKQALTAEDFKLKVTLDDSFKNAISSAMSTLNQATAGGGDEKAQLGYIDSLIQKLKELETQYKNLSKGADTSALVKEFASAQTELDRAGKNLSAAFNKSLSDINKMSESTIGDLKNKIKSLEQYKLNIPLSNPAEITRVSDIINKLKGDITSLFQTQPTNPFQLPENSIKEIEAKIKAIKEVKDFAPINSQAFIDADKAVTGLRDKLVSIGRLNLPQAFALPEQSIEEIKRKLKEIEALKIKAPVSSSDFSDATKEVERLKKLLADINNPPKSARSFAEVMGMDTGTLNQITEKLNEIRRIRGEINAGSPNGMSQIGALNRAEAELLRVQQQRLSVNKQINESFVEQNTIVSKLSKTALSYLTLDAAKSYFERIRDTRGEFERTAITLRTILRDKSAADKLFSQTVELGLKSPFSIMQLNSYIRSLAAYQVKTEELFDTTKRLADISATLNVDMSRLILAYGQVRAATVLRGQELRQFTEAGIPILDALAERFTKLNGKVVTTGDIFDMISKKMVSFEDVKAVLFDMTNQGGIFFDMQGKIAESLSAKWKNLQDALDVMYNSIGMESEGFMKTMIEGLTALIANYDKVEKAITGLVVTYGAYRTAAILNIVATQSLATTQFQIGVILARVRKAWQALTVAMSANPYTIAITLAAALATTIWALHDSTTAQQKAQERLNEEHAKAAEYKEKLKGETDKLIATLRSETATIYDQVGALEKLKELYPAIFSNISLDDFKKIPAADIDKSINAENNKRELDKLKSAYEAANRELSALSKTLDEVSNSVANGFDTTANFNALSNLQNSIGIQKEIVKAKEAEYFQALKIKELADFESLTDDQKIDKLEKQISSLKAQKDELENAYTASQSIFDKWGQIDTAFFSSKISLQGINSELAEANKRLTELKGTQGENYLSAKAKAEKEWRAAYMALADAEKSHKTTVDERNKLKQAAEEAKKTAESLGVDTGTKRPVRPSAQKDPILEGYKKRIDLIKKVNEAYRQNQDVWSDENALKQTISVYGDQLKELGLDFEYITNSAAYFETVLSKLANDPGRLKEVRDSMFPEQDKSAREAQMKYWDDFDRQVEKTKKAYELFNALKGTSLGEDFARRFSLETYQGADLSAANFEEYFDNLVRNNADAASKMGIDLKDKYAKEIKETLTGLLNDFQSTEDKILAIRAKYNARLEELEKHRNTLGDKEADRRADLIREAMGNEIAALTEGLLEMTDAYQRLFGNIADLSEKEMTYLTEKFRTAIEQAQTAGKGADGLFHFEIDGEQFSKTEKQMSSLVNSLTKAEKELRDRNPFKALLDSFGQLQNGLQKKKDVADEIESLKKYISVTKNTEGYNSSSVLQGSVGSAEKQIVSLKDKLKAIDAQNASTWKAMSLKISAVTQSVTELGGSVVSLFEAFGADEDTTGTLDDIIGIVGGLGDTASGVARMASGDVIGGLTQSIKGIAGVVSSITNLGDRKHEKQIRRLQEAIDASKIAYEELGRAASKALGNAEYDTKKLQIAELKRQQQLIQGQIKEEDAKKKTDKDKIKNWEEEYRRLGYEIEDIITGITESLIGNIKNMANEMANALVEAFEAGDDAQEAMFKSIKNNLKQTIAAQFQKSVIEKLLEPLFDNMDSMLGITADAKAITDQQDKIAGLKKQMDETPAFTFNSAKRAALKKAIEQAEAELKKLQSKDGNYKFTPEQVKELINQAGNISEDVMDIFNSGGWKEIFDALTGPKELSGLSKGIQGLTEDTAQILEAYLNTIRDVTISIKMTGENQLSVLQASQLIQSQILTEVSMMSSATVSIDRSIRSVIAQSNGDNGAGIRVFIK